MEQDSSTTFTSEEIEQQVEDFHRTADEMEVLLEKTISDIHPHAGNPNLHIYFDDKFKGYDLPKFGRPYLLEYLENILEVVDNSLNDYSRVFAFRVDLRYPEDDKSIDNINDSNVNVSKFIVSLKAKIRHNRIKALMQNDRNHDTKVRYIWCREVGADGKPHYHVVVFLNYYAFCTLGTYESGRSNLYNMVNEAWASAIGVSFDKVWGLVNFPKNPFYKLERDYPPAINEFFWRVSYLAKAFTKVYGNGVHGFGCSQR